MSARSFPVIEADLTTPPTAAAAEALADALRAGALVDAAVLTPAGCAAVVAEITALQAARFDPRARHFTEILWTETEASLGWGTEQCHGTERLDRAALPALAAVADRVDAMCRPLRAPGERLLLSITPSIDKDRSFPRFYHQDSPTRPHCYRLVWDLGLARPGEILDVHFMPRARVEDAAGRIRPAYAHLFQQVAFDDHYALDDAAIDARQPQVREETLPTPADRAELRRGHALCWIDPLFYHSTYLRAGRALAELRPDGRSIVIIREVVGHTALDLPTPDALARMMGFDRPVGG
ncbi:MAG: hypothetical protein H6701_11850 [Myxococcales bacterium]|nr:hypothetical protein [Myxococcales bacterium]